MKLADTKKHAGTKSVNLDSKCCVSLDVGLWDEREFSWKEKPFLTDLIKEFLYVPAVSRERVSRGDLTFEKAGDFLRDRRFLADELSPWGVDMGDTFLTKVLVGSSRNTRRLRSEMELYVLKKGQVPISIHAYSATCPKCAKDQGENRMVLIAHVE